VPPAVRARRRSSRRPCCEHLDYVGVLAIELFCSRRPLLANEMAPRVHNSGHWTIEGSLCSQFENHLRAVLGCRSAARRWPAAVSPRWST
jgi:5-(carboxyamino)imidazole ribonucleotide synthase